MSKHQTKILVVLSAVIQKGEQGLFVRRCCRVSTRHQPGHTGCLARRGFVVSFLGAFVLTGLDLSDFTFDVGRADLTPFLAGFSFEDGFDSVLVAAAFASRRRRLLR